MQPRSNVPLAPFTTLGVGGPARFYVCARQDAQAIDAISWALDRSLPWMILGGGSNVVVSDVGFDGLVVHLETRGISEAIDGDDVVLRVAAGENWDGFVATCVEQHWTGVESLSGIPGRVGATPIQNVGAYGQEVRDTIVAVDVFDTVDAKPRRLSADECEFAYRDSRFKSREPHRFVVLAATFRLRRGAVPQVRYAELQRALREVTPDASTASLQQIRDTVLKVRRGKSMVVDENDPNSRSVGSFFVNPVVDDGTRVRIAALSGAAPPCHAVAGGVKLSAAWLIERAGFPRGYSKGRAGLSQNHALAVINRGGATAGEILALVREIQEGVQARLGVQLQPEPVFVGNL